MCLTQLKQGRTYKNSARAFGCNFIKMRRVIDGFVEKVAEDVYNHFLACNTMANYCARKIMFKRYPNCLEAIDVTFEKSHKRGKKTQEQSFWCSGKHLQPGLKTEVAVGPNGRARYALKSYPGLYHDFTIFSKAIDKYLARLVKEDGDVFEQDNMTVDAIKEN